MAMIVAVWCLGEAASTMNVRQMRRTCAALVRDLDLRNPTDPDELVAALCARMGELLGRPVEHCLVQLPASVSGVWAETDDGVLLLCEQGTSPWHRLAITCHEFWHMQAGHQPGPLGMDAASQLIFSSLRPETIARIVACRSYTATGERDEAELAAEREAEFFASLMLTMVSRWVAPQSWVVPAEAAEVVRRLEASLGGGTGQDERG
jgi:hypothetical protein